jgi:formylglycine-generating enzyme required for sulfatase activity
MTTKLLSLFICLAGTFSLCSQTSQKTDYLFDKKYFKAEGAEFVPTGSYTNASGKTISVQAFFMTNEVTNKEYREFVDYVVSHPDSSLYYFNRKKEGGFSKQQVPFSQIRYDLIDSSAMAKKYPSGSDLHNKYKNYFSDKKFDDYPVVGVSYSAAKYYCIWKTRAENATLQKEGIGLINDFRVPAKEELEYAQSFSPNSAKKSENEVDRSRSGKPDKLGLYNLFGNVDELNSSVTNSHAPSGQIGFRMVSTFLGK